MQVKQNISDTAREKFRLPKNRGQKPQKLGTTQENLDRVARTALQSGQPDEVTRMSDCLRLLSRLCARRGKPVPLYELQQNPAPSRGFMSDPQARVCDLTKQWGYDIVCSWMWVNGAKHSCRWIILGADGMPTIDWTAPKRQGQAKPEPIAAQPTLWQKLPIFQAAKSNFVAHETGAA